VNTTQVVVWSLLELPALTALYLVAGLSQYKTSTAQVVGHHPVNKLTQLLVHIRGWPHLLSLLSLLFVWAAAEEAVMALVGHKALQVRVVAVVHWHTKIILL
jgi:hypothetical protein